MNVSTLLDMAADGFPDRIAIGPSEGGVSYASLRSHVHGAVRSFDGGGDAVIFVGQSGVGFAVAFFACAWLGVPFVPLNYRLSELQLAELIGCFDRSVIIADERYATTIGDLAGGRVLVTEQWYESLAAVPAAEAPEAAYDPGPALYLFTSGTSAAPKASILHHENLASYIFGSVEFGVAEETDCALVSVPPYHIAGVANLLSNIYSGRRIIHLPNFNPVTWLDVVRTEQVTQAMVVPTMLAQIVEEVGPDRSAGTPSLRLMSYGGSRMPETILRRALTAFPGVGFVNAYGLTETSSSIAVLGPDAHRAALNSTDPAVARRLGSVGTALPGIDVEIRDGAGRALPSGRAGDIWVRGDQISGEYVGAASAVDASGWFATRDAGWMDDDGFIFVSGRTDDTIIRGGENIAPAEIEDVLLEHPAVLDVAVVGVPDAQWGQRVAAVVVLRPGTTCDGDALRVWSLPYLRSSRAPELVAFVATLPRTDSGKVVRRALLADLRASLDTASGAAS
jgi:acyl-CoA synthetase (AMP-forming)/AMP-acid ligase II